MSAATAVHQQPLAEMNTTPLIDVLLVLLIMFIMAVPVASNVIPINLPTDDAKPGPIRPDNLLSVTPQGTITWNGASISESGLAATLGAMVHVRPEPLVRFEPAAQAPYGSSARVLRVVKQSGLSGFAFVGNERYAEFGKR